jgi:hypothetical protein
MKWLIDENLAEGVVSLCARGGRKEISPADIRRFHREREEVYATADPDERQRAFARLHLRWFQLWEFEQWLARLVAGFPLLESGLAALGIRKAAARNEEEAELYVNSDHHRHGVVALRPERFLDPEALISLMHHELTHLSDMLDPEFGYSPELSGEKAVSSFLLAPRERYRLLWDITIDGRLHRSGRLAPAGREQRREAFFNAFQFLDSSEREHTFASLWTDPAPRHSRLAELSVNPRGLQHQTGSMPGALCPLCGFPNFSWAGPGSLPENALARIHFEFPAWFPEEGICRRCAEVYTCSLPLSATAIPNG